MTLLVKDTFTGTDGTALTAHTPDTGGGGWIVVEQNNAAPSIKSNGLKLDGGTGNYNETSVALSRSGGYGTNDYVVSGVVVFAENGVTEQFITGRVDTAVGAYKKYAFGYYRDGTWRLRKYNALNGQYSSLASAPTAFPTGSQTLSLRVVTVGGNTLIQCKVNGAVVLATVTDASSPFTSGSAGIVGFNLDRHYPPLGIYVDSFQVDTIPVGAQDVLVSTSPSGAIPSAPFGTQPTGTIADAYGMPVTAQADTITVSKISGPGTLGGTLTAAVNTSTGGWAFTNLQCSVVGSYVLQFASTNGYSTATVSLTVVAATANFSSAILGHATSDAGMTPLDGAIMELRDGTPPANTSTAATGTVGATITFENPATINYASPYGNTIVLPSAMVTATAAITPTWARLYQSDHTTVLLDCPIGALFSTNSLWLSQPALTIGMRVQLEAFTFVDPGFSVSVATKVFGEIAIGGLMDGPAELPRVYTDTTAPTIVNTITVGPSGRNYTDLKLALDAAVAASGNTEVVIDNGYDYIPPLGDGLTLPSRPSATNWIVIRAATMPCSEGVRVTPALAAAANIPKIRLDNGSWAIKTDNGSCYYRLQGLEVLPVAAGGIGEPYFLVNVQPNNSTPGGQGNSYADMPHHITIDRMYMHGASNVNIRAAACPLNGDHVALINSYISEIHCDDQETHGTYFWMQKGPVKMNNNYIEGTGQSVIVGGSESNWPGVVVADIEAQYNTFAKDPAWNGVWHDIKTIFEMKAGRRALIAGNTVQYNWNDPVAGWKGMTFTFKTVNQSGSANVPYWRNCDVTVRDTKISYAGCMFNLSPLPEFVRPATPAARHSFRNVLAVHMGDAPGSPIVKKAVAIDVDHRLTATDFLIDHCTFVYPSLGGQAIDVGQYGVTTPALRRYVRCLVKNSIFGVGGTWAITGRDQNYVDESLAYYVAPDTVSSSLITRNVFSGGPTEASGVPTSAMALLNRFPVNTTDGTYPEMFFNNIAGEDYSLAPGSIYSATGSFAALDGKDLGVDMPSLLAALAGGSSYTPPPIVGGGGLFNLRRRRR